MAVTPWAEKYRPKIIDEYVFQNPNHERLLRGFIADRSIPHLLLKGHRGSGKTTIAYILKNELGIDDVDFLAINASDENSVETIRTKIKSFISTYAVNDIKIVLCDEADYLSPNAQAALRSMMEEYVDNARFILTCNKPHKLMPELKSRCMEINYASLDKDTLMERAAVILKAEKIKVGSIELLETFIDASYPDFRKLLLLLQEHSYDGVLHEPTQIDSSSEYQMTLVDIIENDKWSQVRKLLTSSMNDEDWEDMYRFLYEYIHELGKFKDENKWKAGIIIIADHLYKHSIVADAEINAAAMFIRLGDL